MKTKHSWWSIDPIVGSIALLLIGAGVVATSGDDPVAPPSRDTGPVIPKVQPKAPADFIATGPEGPLTIQRVTASSKYATVRKDAVAPVPGPEPIVQEDHQPSIQAGILPFGTKGEKACINFLSGRFFPPANERIQPDLRAYAKAKEQRSPGSSVCALIMLDDRMNDALQTTLISMGVRLHGYYPESAWRAEIPCSALDNVAVLSHVKWIGQPNNRQKLDPSIYDWVTSGSKEKRQVFIDFFAPDDDSGTVRNALVDAGAKLGTYDAGLALVYAEADAATIQQALSMDQVIFVQPVPKSSTQHTESMVNSSIDYTWGGFDGTGATVKVGVMDTGCNIFHSDLSSILGGSAGWTETGEALNWWDDNHGHGTHVSGSFFGEGNYDFRYRGGAQGIHDTNDPAFDLTVAKVFNGAGGSVGNSVYNGLLDMQNATYRRQVFNYSGGGGSAYSIGSDDTSRKVDEMFGQNIVPCIAAGNSGSGAGTVLIPGVAKGALTVANLCDDGLGVTDTIRPSSSRGPTGGSVGRYKPDIGSEGHWIDSLSNTSNTGYVYGWSGTSMATPHVAAMAAGLVQHYAVNGITAWAVKSILMATAIQMPGLGVNDTGQGKADARLANYVVDSGGYSTWWNTIGGTGSLHYYDITVGSLSRLKVVLTWADPPPASGAGNAIVNDIDLGVQGPGGLTTTWSANWISNSSYQSNEVITIDGVTAGTYRIKIYSYAGSGSPYAVTAKQYVYDPVNTYAGCSISGPAAVMPNTNFTLNGTATSVNNIGSGTYSQIEFMTGGQVLNGETMWRRAPSNAWESFYWAGASGGTNGDIEYAVPRYQDWSVYCTSEGVKQFRMRTRSSTGGEATSIANVIVDGTNPQDWQNFIPSGWTNDTTPTCSIQVRDVLAGLNTSGLYWWYWDGTNINGPYACTTAAANGSTALETIVANDVPFNQDSSGGNNQVYFRAYDRAGNSSDSGWMYVYCDATQPTNWSNFTPSGWTFDTTPDCTINVQDIGSGLNPAYAYYRYSTDGGGTWSSWSFTPCSGSAGSTSLETITASGVPFNQYSASLNKIQFFAYDMVFNGSFGPVMNVPIAAIVEHSGFTLSPGSTISGSDASLFVSDDGRWNLRPGAVLVATADPIVLVLTAVAPAGVPQAIEVVVESSATVTGIRQIVEAWNFTGAGSWTNLETFVGLPTGANPDRVVILNVPSPANHKGPGDAMRVRLKYKNTTAVLVYPWNARIDRMYWRYYPN